MDNQQERMTADLNWLAAAWESEGWFSIIGTGRKKKWDGVNMVYYPMTCIKNTDVLFIGEVKKILENNYIANYLCQEKPAYKTVSGGMAKKQYTIKVSGPKRVKRFLDLMMPYFRTKRDRMLILKEYVEHRLSLPEKTSGKTARYSDVEHVLFNKLRELNGIKPFMRLSLSSTTNTPKITEKVIKIESELRGNLVEAS